MSAPPSAMAAYKQQVDYLQQLYEVLRADYNAKVGGQPSPYPQDQLVAAVNNIHTIAASLKAQLPALPGVIAAATPEKKTE